MSAALIASISLRWIPIELLSLLLLLFLFSRRPELTADAIESDCILTDSVAVPCVAIDVIVCGCRLDCRCIRFSAEAGQDPGADSFARTVALSPFQLREHCRCAGSCRHALYQRLQAKYGGLRTRSILGFPQLEHEYVSPKYREFHRRR